LFDIIDLVEDVRTKIWTTV